MRKFGDEAREDGLDMNGGGTLQAGLPEVSGSGVGRHAVGVTEEGAEDGKR